MPRWLLKYFCIAWIGACTVIFFPWTIILMIFKGGEMASRQVGAAPKAKLQQWISAAV